MSASMRQSSNDARLAGVLKTIHDIVGEVT